MLKLRYFGIIVISLIAALVLTLGLINYSNTQAASYDNINFQGKLTDANGFGVVSSTKSVTFCIFNASSGGSCSSTPSGQLWYETKNVTTDARGIFNTALGDTTSFGTLFSAYANTNLYLAVNVAGDGEMVPRHPIGSVPNAYSAQTLLGKTWAVPGAIGSTTASSGAFTTISVSSVLTSTITTGTAPFTIASTTKVNNLNADLIDGIHAATTRTNNYLLALNSNGKFDAPTFIPDTRAVVTTPSSYSSEMQLNFKSNSTIGLAGGSYSGVMGIAPWSDDSGGGHHELAFTDATGNLYYRYGTIASGWGAWNKIWHQGNDGSGSGLDADLLDGSHASDFAISVGGTGYIQNQTSSDQSASFRVSGSAYIATSLGLGTTTATEKLDVNGRLHLAQTTAPSTVTDKLYNVSGNLVWNGNSLLNSTDVTNSSVNNFVPNSRFQDGQTGWTGWNGTTAAVVDSTVNTQTGLTIDAWDESAWTTSNKYAYLVDADIDFSDPYLVGKYIVFTGSPTTALTNYNLKITSVDQGNNRVQVYLPVGWQNVQGYPATPTVGENYTIAAIASRSTKAAKCEHLFNGCINSDYFTIPGNQSISGTYEVLVTNSPSNKYFYLQVEVFDANGKAVYLWSGPSSVAGNTNNWQIIKWGPLGPFSDPSNWSAGAQVGAKSTATYSARIILKPYDDTNASNVYVTGVQVNGGNLAYAYSPHYLEAEDANARLVNNLSVGGNVGIGVINSTAKLEVAGEIKISGQTPGLTLDAGSGDSGAYLNLHGRYLGVDYPAQIFANYLGGLVMMPNSSIDPTVTIGHASGAVGNTLGVYGKGAIGTSYYAIAAPTNGLIVEGNVGIGTSTPTIGALQVSGGTSFNAIPANTTAVGQINSTTAWVGQGFLFSSGANDAFSMVYASNVAWFGGVSNVAATPWFTLTSTTTTARGNLEVQGTGNSTIAGNLGIGTTYPKTQLHLGTETPALSIGAITTYGGASGQEMSAITSILGANGQYGGSLNFQTNSWGHVEGTYAPATRMTILPYGNVGIGDVTPTNTLDVSGSIGISDTTIIDASRNLVNTGTINGQTISSAANFTGTVNIGGGLSSLTATNPTNTSYNLPTGSAGNYFAYSPIPKVLWHDRLAFSKSWGVPTFQTYNGTWNSATLDSGLFSQQEDRAVQQIDGTTNTAARWTWNSGSASYSYVEYWLVGVTWSPVSSSKDFLIESSADGVTWTTRHASTANTANTSPVMLKMTDNGGDPYIRLTITVTNGQPLNLSTIRALSSRWGNQGGGSEQESPYVWDPSQNIAFGLGAIVANGVVTVGTNTTVASGGLYFGTDANLYRAGANQLKTDDNLVVGGLLEANTGINVASGNQIALSGPGGTGTGGAYVSWYSGSTRMGYMGWEQGRIETFLENGYNYTINGGNVGIGLTNPTGRLHLAAGTTTAGTAPLKLTAGTNLSVAEAGAVEWDGSRLYITQTSGPTRKTVAYTDEITSGMTNPMTTTGDIIYASNTASPATPARLAGSAGFLKSSGAAAPTWSSVTKTDVGLGNVPNLTFSGSNTGDQTISLTGDVTASGGTGVLTTTIAANAVDGTMIALGSDATGDIMYYNGTDYVRLAGSSGFLKSSGAAAPTWSSVTKTDVGLGNVPNLTFSGSNTGDQTITLTGDVTGSGTGSFVTTIANNSVDGTDIALGSDTTGDIMYYNGTDYVRLGGSAGFLKSTGAAAPTWSTITDADVPDTITLTNINQITNRDHGSLTGLTDDDHSIYALLAGRASGQILTGGTGSTDDLVLKTTSGAGTSGADMIFQTGTNGGTEAMRILYNGDVGIGTASPNSRLEVYRGGAVTGSNYGIGTTNSTTSSTAGISKFGIASTVTGSWNNSSTSSQTYGAQFSNSTTGGYGTYGVVAMNTSSGVYNYGGYFAAIGGGTNNYAVYANGSNGSTYNYGIYSAAGNNYMADQLALGRSNTSVGNNYYLVIGNGSSGSLYADGVIKGAGGFNGQCLIDAANQFKDAATRSCNMDIAEIYESTEDIASGDIVMIDPNVDGKVKKSTESYNSTLIGIATSTPGVILGYNGGDVMMAGQANTYMESADPRKPAIALIGKAPIKISLENGPIYKGDILTSSSTPGVAMKATKPGMAIGKALMDSSDQEDGKIMAYIHPEFVDVGGQVNSALSSINSLYDQYAQIQNEISGIRNDLLIQNVSGATGLLSPKQESILESFDINVEGHLVVKGDLEIKGKLELSNNNSRGANVVVVEGSNDLKVVFDKPRENNNYTVLVTPSWMTNFAVKKKSEKGFEVEFSVEAPENSTADWLIID